MAKKQKKKTKKEDSAGIFIPAGVLLGLGIGMVYGNAGAGVLIGLGAGFLVMAIIKLIKR
jgi:hypothetical protein